MAVIAVHAAEPVPYAGGRTFGDAGPAVLRRLRIEHAVDPDHPANRVIEDLELAERGGDGLVHFDHDVVVVQPATPQARNRWVMVDVVNRGRSTIPQYLMGDSSPPFPQPEQPPPGDGSLLAAGWTLVAAGWQVDVAGPPALGLQAPLLAGDVRGRVGYSIRPSAPATKLPLSSPGHWTWPVAPGSVPVLLEDGVEVPAAGWSLAPDGLTMRRPSGFVAGCTYRCEYEATGARVAGCGLLALRDLAPWLRAEEGMGRAVLFGVSQSGRLIRQFLHDGLNADVHGARAYDAVVPVIAGGRRGQFNRRFAVPGALPGEEPDGGVDDDVTYGRLLAPSDAAGVTPKVMALNTSSEYWRGDAAGLHDDPHPDVRVHHVAGTQHTAGVVPQQFVVPMLGWRGRHGFGTVDYRPVLRALLAQLVDWLDHDVPAGPSEECGPSHLTDRATVLAAFEQLGRVTPRVGSFVQPPGAVPAVDDVGNELGAIRLPDVAAPIGVHAGWNVRHPDAGAPDDEVLLMGSTWWFDELPSLPEHLAAARRVVDELVGRRLLLAEDREAVVAQAEQRWHEARRHARLRSADGAVSPAG